MAKLLAVAFGDMMVFYRQGSRMSEGDGTMGRIEKKSYERYDFYDGSFRRAPAKPPRAAPQILAPLLVRLPAPCSCVGSVLQACRSAGCS